MNFPWFLWLRKTCEKAYICFDLISLSFFSPFLPLSSLPQRPHEQGAHVIPKQHITHHSSGPVLPEISL